MNIIQVSEKIISISAGQIYLKRWKPTKTTHKNPIILFHDSLGCVQMWRDFPEELAKILRREVIAYDRLGFGQSSARDQLHNINFINEEAEIYFSQIIDALKIDKFLLFGHSVGGAMVLTCANNFTDRCELVISESAQAFVEEKTKQGIIKAAEEFKNTDLFLKLVKYHGKKAQWVLNSWTEVWLSSEFSKWELRADLKNIRCPALVIHGDRDEYGSSAFPDIICESIATAKKNIIEDCGHVPHRDKPKLILEVVSEFIARLS